MNLLVEIEYMQGRKIPKSSKSIQSREKICGDGQHCVRGIQHKRARSFEENYECRLYVNEINFYHDMRPMIPVVRCGNKSLFTRVYITSSDPLPVPFYIFFQCFLSRTYQIEWLPFLSLVYLSFNSMTFYAVLVYCTTIAYDTRPLSLSLPIHFPPLIKLSTCNNHDQRVPSLGDTDRVQLQPCFGATCPVVIVTGTTVQNNSVGAAIMPPIHTAGHTVQ